MTPITSGSDHAEQVLRNLLAQLEKGWRAGSADSVLDFLSRWRDNVTLSTRLLETHDNFLYFTADMGNIRLNGMDEAHCLIISGAHFNEPNPFAELWRKINGAGRFLLILCLSRESYTFVLRTIPEKRAAVLDPGAIGTILLSDAPLEPLKRSIRDQLSARRLSPFNIKNAVHGHMFFGRSRLINRLRSEDDVSFAIAGPGRIGKSSVLRRYLMLLKRERDPRLDSTAFIDCSSCEDRSADGFVRYLALKIDSRQSNTHLTSGRVGNFFRFWQTHHNRPLTLLLDEVDEIFHPTILKDLFLAAKDQLCRLVFAGKGVLLRSMLHQESPLACRIDLLQLDPLRPEEATKLLLEPLNDLGFEIHDRQEILGLVHELSGDLPHLVQYFGSRLVDLVETEDSKTVCLRHVEQVRDSFEATSYFMSPFHDLTDPKERILALAMLSHSAERMQLPDVRRCAAELGLILEHQQVWDLCLGLTICNVLAMDNGAFRIANRGLRYYANQTGFTQGALQDARASLAKATGR
jgi:hypothetical protein